MKKFMAISAILSASLLTGCAMDVSKIHRGMARKDVSEAIGNPDYNAKARECWKDRIMTSSPQIRGDYCINYDLADHVSEYGWENTYQPRTNVQMMYIVQ